jgi:uncharacterized membrane protein YfcA
MPWILLLLCVSALGAGVVNAIAGGGTLLSFPALVLALGNDRAANVTSTVALVPGSLAGAFGFGEDLRKARPWLHLLIPPSILGGLVGSLLLILLPGSYFTLVVPWLLLTATLLFLFQPILARYLQIEGDGRLPRPALCVVLAAFQFLVAVYGGFFGAGIGILMLSGLGLMGLGDLNRMNAVKNLLAAIINGVSVIVFCFSPQVAWPLALLMAVAAVGGGYLGARVGRRLPRPLVRWTVILIGLGLTVYYVLKQFGAGPSA